MADTDTSTTDGAVSELATEQTAGDGAELASEQSKARDAKAKLRAKHVKQLERALADEGDRPVEEKRETKAKTKTEKAPVAKRESKAPEKAATPKEKEKEKEEPGEPPEAAERREKREFSKFRARETRRLQAREENLTGREATAKQREERLAGELEAFDRDPLKWLAGRGKNIKQVLLDYAKQDAEDPKDKLLREAREKAEAVERRLAEREEREKVEASTREQREAQQHIRGELSREWESVRDSDDYPYLSTLYEPDEVAQLGLETLMEYYKRTRGELTAGQVFARLEQALRREDEARQKARSRARGEADDDGSSRPPDRVRSVKSESPEANERRPTHDVTNRNTRVASGAGHGPNGEQPKYDRSRLIAMARDAMSS